MDAVISDNRWVYLENLTPDFESVIDDHFSAKDPNSIFIDDSMEQSWDGLWHRYQTRQQRLSKGFLAELIALCEEHNMPLDVVDKRQPSSYPMFSKKDVVTDLLPGITLEKHQTSALLATTDNQPCNEIGTFWQITGSGKTELICGLTKLLKCPTVIIAEETIVVQQIQERLQLREVAGDIGMFFAGKRPDGQLVCVGSLQSVMPPPKIKQRSNEAAEKFAVRLKGYKTRIKNAKTYRDLIKRCELLMIDECDKACNKQYRKLVMQYANARYVYGFTGTLPDKADDPVDCLNMRELLGSVIATSNRRYLEKIGRIIPVKYITKVFGPSQRTNKAAFDIAVRRWMIENKEFHGQVNIIVESFPNDNFLVLVDSIELGLNLEQMIEGSTFIHGKTPKKKQALALRAFESKEIRVLIGSKILKRGLDLKGGIDNLILCASSKKNSELEQKVGRALRVNIRRWARVFDFMPICNSHLYKHARKRLRLMIRLGYPTSVMAGGQMLDGKKVTKRGFNLFRYI